MQTTLFPIDTEQRSKIKASGTFSENMKLPVHRWFRYSAGFSAEWAESAIKEYSEGRDNVTVLDPFAGSGTTLLAADKVGVCSVGIEAHPFVYRIAKAKLLWHAATKRLSEKAITILNRAQDMKHAQTTYPKLLLKCFDSDTLVALDKLRLSWVEENDNSPESELVWLAITAILRACSPAGTAPWQYVLPRKRKRVVCEPFSAFEGQVQAMCIDMAYFKRSARQPKAELIQADARQCSQIKQNTIDLVITSPPYANNYDYADATRLEMTFWGEVASWGDLHEVVRKYLICSSAQHSSKARLTLCNLLSDDVISPIAKELSAVCYDLARERQMHAGRKTYHTMVAAYFGDMAKTWQQLRRVCKQKSSLCYIVGDSAPYGIYVPVDQWLGRLALAAGFKSYHFEKLRDRNIKWKNRKHRVPLHEGRLWIEG